MKERLKQIITYCQEDLQYYGIKDFVTKEEIPANAELVNSKNGIGLDYFVVQQTGTLGDDYTGVMWFEVAEDFYAVVEYSC